MNKNVPSVSAAHAALRLFGEAEEAAEDALARAGVACHDAGLGEDCFAVLVEAAKGLESSRKALARLLHLTASAAH